MRSKKYMCNFEWKSHKKKSFEGTRYGWEDDIKTGLKTTGTLRGCEVDLTVP
jgi:hypothetical protein